MKKMISASLLIVALATAGFATAQVNDKDMAFIPAKNHAAYLSFIAKTTQANENAFIVEDTLMDVNANAKAAKANFKAIKANDKALKSFKTSYRKNTPDASWFAQEDGIFATFTKDNVKTNVVYNKKGNWLHTLTYYPEDKTPAFISDIIDNVYPKDDIRLTIMVEEGNMMFYIVQLESKTKIRKVAVYNGEAKLIEELTKSN